MDTTREKLDRILQEILNPGEDIDDDATLADLGADSLDIVEIVLGIEEDFSIRITDDETSQHIESTTIAEIADWLDGKVGTVA